MFAKMEMFVFSRVSSDYAHPGFLIVGDDWEMAVVLLREEAGKDICSLETAGFFRFCQSGVRRHC